MISIQNSLSELDRRDRARVQLLDCYVAAIKNAAHYVVELDGSITTPHRQHLEALAVEVASADSETLEGSRSTLRGLFREYRDKAARYLSKLREELSGTARTLEEILTCFNQSDGDHEKKLRTALSSLRGIPATGSGSLRAMVLAAADSIEETLDELRQQHKQSLSQFTVEIRMLHKRIDELETAAAVDSLTGLCTRREMEDRIRAITGEYCLLLIRAMGFRVPEVQEELAGGFAKRLCNALPPDAVTGRWSNDEFIVVVALPKPQAIAKGKWIAENLSGNYACMLGGKLIHPSLQVNVAVVERAGESPEGVLKKVGNFFVAR